MAQIKDNENKYLQIFKKAKKNTKSSVFFLLFLKAVSFENELFYLFSIFFRFLGFLIICCNFNNNSDINFEHPSISNIFRALSSYGLIQKIKISNIVYNIISIIIFILFLIIIFLDLRIIASLKNKHISNEISILKIQIILHNLLFLFFPYIIEFLSFIFYIQFFGDKFIIKKNSSNLINITIMILNTLLIIIFNIQDFFNNISINNPFDEKNNKIKLNYRIKKIIIISLLQNIIIIECLGLYLNNYNLTIYNTTLSILVLLIFIIFYLNSYNKFNYNTKTNYLINILSIFCFFSLFFEMILYFLEYKIQTYTILFFYSILKLIISFLFDYVTNNLYEIKMINLLSEKLFKIYDDKNNPDNNDYDCLFYFNELYKKLKENDEDIKKMVNIILIHLSKCNSIECKCKYIQIFPYGKKYSKDYINYFLERINLLVETIFVDLDYTKNYELTLLLAEHYYNFKDNPIISYSMIKTMLYFNTKLLNISQSLILLTTLTKYIEKCNNKNSVIIEEKNIEEEARINRQKTLFKTVFANYNYLTKIKKIIKKYASDFIKLIKFKENIEESLKFKKDFNNDIVEITSYFLTTKNINNIMKILLDELEHNKNLKNYLKKIDANKVPIDIIYKCALFSELFLCYQYPDEMISLLYSLNSGKNLYSLKFQSNILSSLELNYINQNLQINSNYFLIFKFTDGIKVHYFNETLSKKLGFLQKELLNSSIEKAMPKDFRNPHKSAVIKHIINDKNRTFKTDIFLFDKDMEMHPAAASGISMPGFGKYLFCIIKIVLSSKQNEYYFYLGKNLECISLSKNFNNYHISLNYLNKYKINILKLIDFKLEDLEVLKKDIIKINKYKDNLDMITDYFYTQRLFKEKSKYNSNNNNFRLLSLMKKNEKIHNDDNIEINNYIDEDEINLIKKNANIKYQYRNLKKNLLKKREKKSRKVFFDKIDELMNKYNNENAPSIKRLIYFSSKTLINNENKKEIEKIDTEYGYFNIEFGLTILYDTYFYLFKLEEIYKETPLINKDMNNDTLSIHRKCNEVKSPDKISNKEISTILEIQKEIKINYFKINKVKCFNLIVPFAIFLLGILLIIYIIILLYQRYMVSSGHNGFLIYYYNYYQRDQLFSLYSVLLSSYFHYLKMTDLNDVMEEDDYIDLIERYSSAFQNSFHIFYNIYITNKDQDINKINYIFEELEVYKISNYYNQTNIIDNYIKHSEYIGYISRLISIEDKIENIIEDSKLLFLGNIFNNENGSKIPTKTYYIQTLYYLSRNYESLFNKIYTNLEKESTSDFNELANNSRINYLILEILGFIIIIIFYIISIIFLFQTNIAIFRNIINIFISNNNKDNYNYKNKKENYFLIKIISDFISLINDFNLDNLHKFQFILNRSTIQNISSSSTLNIRDDNNSNSFFTNRDYESKNKINKNKTKKDFVYQIIDNKNKSSESIKLNLSSSKASLKNNNVSDDILKNLNNPEVVLENNNSINITKSTKNNDFNTNNKLKIKTYNRRKLEKLNKEKKNSISSKKKKIKIEENFDDKEKMTTEIFLQKLVNNGLKEIKISMFILNFLFFIVIIYVSVKIIFSLNFITEIIGIFEDFGVLSYRYSSMYYYFNSLRTLLVFPDFGNETIFETMNENMADRLKRMNFILDFKLDKYPSVGNYYLITGTNMKKSRPSPSYINNTCYEDQFCRKIINHTKYEVLSEGLKMAVTFMYQQIINIYNDYKKEKENIKKIKLSSYIKEKFINSQFMQIDINLNYVFICIEYRIYEAFMTDLISLVNKYNSIIEILNLCAIIYIFIFEFIVMVFIILNLKKTTKKIEDATVRINNALNFMLKRNKYDENKQEDSSIIANDN